MSIVYVVRVQSRSIVGDVLAQLKNFIGGRIKVYESMLQSGLSEAIKEFEQKYPGAKNIRIDTEQLTTGMVSIVITGDVQ